MGLLTSLLNPKTAALYLSLLPQFIDRASGDILAQTLTLGALQIAISVCFNTTFVLAAGTIAAFLAATAAVGAAATLADGRRAGRSRFKARARLEPALIAPIARA